MACKFCEGIVTPFLNLGKLPLGNAFLKKEGFATEKLYKLELGICKRCALVQQTHPPPTDALQEDYRNYSYVPFGETLRSHYQKMAEEAFTNARLGPGSLVVDVGSNNGLFLKFMQAKGSRVLGVEPAKNIAQQAEQDGVPTINTFFDESVVERILFGAGQKADLVTCTQTLQHIPDLNGFIGGLVSLLKPAGTLMIEGRYFGSTVQKTSYDTIYHEMLYFFSLHSLQRVLKRHGLTIWRDELTDVYGGSLRVYASKEGRRYEGSFPLTGMADPNTYRACSEFATDVKKKAAELHDLIVNLHSRGERIAAYGAPSTSATLLNYCGIGREQIEYVVDDSPLKQGLYTPGTHIRIVPADTLEVDPPAYLLVNAWRLKDEILPKVQALRDAGMKVILPLPEVSIV